MSRRYSEARSGPRLSDREIRRLAEDVTVQFALAHADSESTGSGFVVSADVTRAWVVTNRHVVRDIIAEESYIESAATGQRAGFRILDVLPYGADLAIVETKMRFLDIPRISARKHLEAGEDLWMFGYPDAIARHARGRYSHRQNDEVHYARDVDSKYIKVLDLQSAPGSSGSAIFDAYGEVVAVQSKGPWGGSPPCYAVPVPYLRKLLRENDLEFVSGGQPDYEIEYVDRRRPRGSYDGYVGDSRTAGYP